MARKPQSDRSILEMFSKLGEDLKMPNVDVDAILAHHRKNLEALETVRQGDGRRRITVMNRQREMLQETLPRSPTWHKHLRTPGTPQEVDVQAGGVRPEILRGGVEERE